LSQFIRASTLVALEKGDAKDMKSDSSAMKTAILRAATSLALIVIVAMGVRWAFAWDQARKISPDALGIVPFQQEAGNIAYALARGKGFSNVFRTETGPTAWLLRRGLFLPALHLTYSFLRRFACRSSLWGKGLADWESPRERRGCGLFFRVP
jgi:hypothetical protein